MSAVSTPGPPIHTDPERQHYGLTLLVLVGAALSYALSQTMVVPALPEIQRELGSSQTTTTFVLTAFLLTASIATPILGRLGDMFGKERMLVLTLCLFALGSLLAAASHSIALLIAGRAIQGAAGAVFPLAFGIIRDEFPPERVATGIGLISATFGIGGGAGLVLSGVIVDHLSYEWIFWSALGVSALAIAATQLFVPESPVKSPARIDWGGAGQLALGLTALLIGVSEGNDWGWGSVRVIGLFCLAALVLVLWVRYERRQPQPMVDMEMMRRPAVLTTNLTALLVGFGMFGSFILIPQLVELPASTGFGFGATTTQAGLFLLPSAVVMLFAGPISGLLGDRSGSKLPLLIGTVTAASAFASLALFHETHLGIYIGSTLLGIGIGFAFAAMANLIVDAVRQTEVGVATGINTIMRSIGGSLGAQIAAAIVAGQLASDGLPAERGFVLAFAMSAIALLLATGVGLAIPTRPRRAAATETVAAPAGG
jgi:EmrB/QacA subfamily drug resistance transporter